MKTRHQIYLGSLTVIVPSLYALYEWIPIWVSSLLVVVLLALLGILELYIVKKETKYIQLSKDIDPRKIKITNNGYDRITGCTVMMNTLRIMGNNGVCEEFTLREWDSPFIIEPIENQTITINNSEHSLINIYEIENDNIYLTFKENGQKLRIPLPRYQDPRFGNNALRGKYQLEIKLIGTGIVGGGTSLIKLNSCWEIKYRWNEMVGPSFNMQKINKICEPNGIIERRVPHIHRFILTISNLKTKNLDSDRN